MFYADEKTFDAVLMNFVIIGEAVARLSETLRITRNLVVHDYFGVDAEEVWQIIQLHIPALHNSVTAILA